MQSHSHPLSELIEYFKPHQIITDPSELKIYGQDWTRIFDPKALALIFPQSSSEVQKIVQWANKNQVGLVPSGGRTGLSGGAVALNNEVIVSFDKMNKISPINFDDFSIECEAGAITENIQKIAQEHSLFFPIDFAAAGSSQIGGNVATNVGGVNVIRYGMIRHWITSLEVVTGSGQILHLNKGLEKNNTGYDLRHLFIGSEGTLGFITKVTLKLTHPPQESTVLLAAASNSSSILEVFRAFRSLKLNAFEVFCNKGLQHVLSHMNMSPPFKTSYPLYFIVDFESPSNEEEKALSIFEKLLDHGHLDDGVLSQSPSQYKNLWAYRENISESISKKMPYKNDVSVRTSFIPHFIEACEKYMDEEFKSCEVVWFGHIGDGNLHINILKPENMNKNDFKKMCQEKSPSLFKKIQEFEGSISAEHGIGLIKKENLKFSRSAEEIDCFKQIKKVFDPHSIMNPGKLIP